MRRTALLSIPAALALAGSAAWVSLKPKPQEQWRYATLERGEVERKVTATGTANALIQPCGSTPGRQEPPGQTGSGCCRTAHPVPSR